MTLSGTFWIYLFFVLSLVLNCLCKINCTDVNIVIAKNANEGEYITFDGITYKPNEYFRNETTGEIHGCICEKKTCVNKCCPIGYSTKGRDCVETNTFLDPPLIESGQRIENTSQLYHFYVTKNKLNCKVLGQLKVRLSELNYDWGIDRKGNLITVSDLEVKSNATCFCIDNFLKETGGSILDARVCLTPDKEPEYLNYNVTATCMLISCIFIILTITMYMIIPELLTVSGKLLITYLMCLFVSFLFLAIMQLAKLYNTNSPKLCVSLTFIIYFGFQSTFFWLCIMSFHVWSGFKNNLFIHYINQNRRYAGYAAFGFGVPALLTILLAVLEFSDLPYSPMLPLIRRKGCFIEGSSKLLYLYGPMIFTYIINITCFVMTAIEIKKLNFRDHALINDLNRREQLSLHLTIKLFFIMGISWILEIISYFFPPQAVWYIVDIYNLLTGVIIFIISVCPPNTKLVRERFRKNSFRIFRTQVESAEDLWPLREFTDASESRTSANDDSVSSLGNRTCID